jgi:hypothetical protein
MYICDSKTAKAYHKGQNCWGLNRCMHAVVKVTKREAGEEYGRVGRIPSGRYRKWLGGSIYFLHYWLG